MGPVLDQTRRELPQTRLTTTGQSRASGEANRRAGSQAAILKSLIWALSARL